MALKLGQSPSSFTGLLKEGYKQLDDAVLVRNIHACRDMSAITKTSFGPHGKNKMVVNTLEKLFVTSDAATILRELEVAHPAAKLLVMNARQQEQEYGDGTNLSLIFAGELLHRAEDLVRIGLHPGDILEGYELGLSKALAHLDTQVLFQVSDISSPQMRAAIRTAIASKQYGVEEFLTSLVIEACSTVVAAEQRVRQRPFLNMDSIRVVKIMGGSVHESRVVPGMVFHRQPESKNQRATGAKVAVYSCAIDLPKTETKGTVLIQDAQQLLSFSKGEETLMEQQIKAIADSGVSVLVTGQTVGDLALFYANLYHLVVVKVPSKFDLQRLCRILGATALNRLSPPTPEEVGRCDVVEAIEIGSDRCTIFRQDGEAARTCTILLRGSTMNYLDDLERALDDGIHTAKTLLKDGRLLPGAGATELGLSEALAKAAHTTPGLVQYGLQKFAEALEIVPKLLVEHSGILNQVTCSPEQVVSHLIGLHRNGQADAGVCISPDIVQDEDASRELVPSDYVVKAAEGGIWDSYATKKSALQLAVDAALTVMRIDMIIMSKPAGGPKPRQMAGTDSIDDD